MVFYSVFLSCSDESDIPDNAFESFQYTGSTPCDSMMKSIFSFPQTEIIDFMKWGLSLAGSDTGKNSFTLKIIYGEAEQGTQGFKHGGKTMTISGDYSISESNDKNLFCPRWQIHYSCFQIPKRVCLMGELHALNLLQSIIYMYSPIVLK